MKREMVSANCYKGRRIKAEDLMDLNGRSVCMKTRGPKMWEIMPVSFLVNMQFVIVMRRVRNGLFLVHKIEREKKNHLVQLAVERAARKKKKNAAIPAEPDDVILDHELW